MFGLRKSPLTLRGGGNLTDVAHILYTPVHEMWKGIHITTLAYIYFIVYTSVLSQNCLIYNAKAVVYCICLLTSKHLSVSSVIHV